MPKREIEYTCSAPSLSHRQQGLIGKLMEKLRESGCTVRIDGLRLIVGISSGEEIELAIAEFRHWL